MRKLIKVCVGVFAIALFFGTVNVYAQDAGENPIVILNKTDLSGNASDPTKGADVRYDAFDSYDPDGKIVKVEWFSYYFNRVGQGWTYVDRNVTLLTQRAVWVTITDNDGNETTVNIGAQFQ